MKLDRVLTLGVAIAVIAGCSAPSTSAQGDDKSEPNGTATAAQGPAQLDRAGGEATETADKAVVAAAPRPPRQEAVPAIDTPGPAATPPAPMAPPAAFAGCAACHDVGPSRRNGVGPTLVGVYGAAAGSNAAGYAYSDALKSSGVRWTESILDRWLADPQGLVPGTTMAIGGMQSAAERQAIIAYLRSLPGR